jgi:hypothetical protein
MLHTALALATKARAIARRSFAGLPTQPRTHAINASMCTMFSSATSCRCFSVNGPDSSCSAGNKAPLHYPHELRQPTRVSFILRRGILPVWNWIWNFYLNRNSPSPKHKTPFLF